MSRVPRSAGALYATMLARGSAEFLVRPTRSPLRYDELVRDVRACCGLFDTRGLKPGDRVLILTGDEVVAITVFVAAFLDGLVPVVLTADTQEPRAAAIATALSPGLTAVDAVHAAEPWAAGAVVAEPAKKDWFGRVRAAMSGSLKAELATHRGRAPRLPDTPDAPAYVMFTSGTTAAPKGVIINHRALFAQVATFSRLGGHDSVSRIFNSMVLGLADWVAQGVLLALANGCALIRPGPFTLPNLEPWLNSVRALRATHVLAVPTIYALIDRYAAHDDYFDAPECRALISTASKLHEALWHRLEQRFQRPVFNQYGLSETTAAGLYAGSHPEMGPAGTIGKPVDMLARVVAADGSNAAAGEAGELWLSGDNVFARYWRDPARTAEALSEGGWLRTGDLVRKRPDGAYDYLGRMRLTIKSGGVMIMPDEINEALLAHPAVAEAVTIGLPDDAFGEVAVSAVVIDRRIEETELVEHCRERLETAKVPKRVLAVAAIPRVGGGKPNIDVLRTMLDVDAPAPSAPHGAIAAGVLEVAGKVFRVPESSLTLDATPADVAEWDSFAHVALVLAAERRFAVRIATADVTAIRMLADLAAAIERAR